jgi:DNA-binding NarL/FixJ family response regulator
MIEAIRAILEPEFDLIGTAANGRELVEAARQLDPDVLVVDLAMPVMGGLEAVAACRADGLRAATVIVTVSIEADLAQAALKAGARGYVTKDRITEDLRSAIRAVLRGATFVSCLD